MTLLFNAQINLNQNRLIDYDFVLTYSYFSCILWLYFNLMDSSQTASDKKDSFSDNSKTNPLPIVICLDSQSQNIVNQPEQNHNIHKSSTTNEKKVDAVVKRKRIKRTNKHKKVLRQVHEIIDDDVMILNENRKSVRLSKKGPKNYRQAQKRRIKRTDPVVQQPKNNQQTSNTLQQNSSAITENSEGPVQGLLNKKMNIEQNTSGPQNQSSTCQKMNPEINNEKVTQIMPNVMFQSEQNKGVQNSTNSQGILNLPSKKFQNQFLQKNNIDRRQAICNSIIKNSGPKPRKYLKEIQETLNKQPNNTNNQNQADPMTQIEQKTGHVNQTANANTFEVQSKQVHIIMIEDSQDENDNCDQRQRMQSVESHKQIKPVIQQQPIQIEEVNNLNQHLSIHQHFPEQNKNYHNQNVQKPILYIQPLQDTDNQLNYPHQSQIIAQNPQVQKDLQLPPGQRLIKAKLKRKITKKTVFYSNVQEITNNWENNPYLSFEQDYPFYSHLNLNKNCNLFTDKLRSIVRIRKYQRPEIHPATCFVFFQSQNDINLMPLKNFNDYQVQKPTPHEVELDKVRILYPQKLLEFYELVSIAKLQKATSNNKAETQYDLPEKTQDRIKHQYY